MLWKNRTGLHRSRPNAHWERVKNSPVLHFLEDQTSTGSAPLWISPDALQAVGSEAPETDTFQYYSNFKKQSTSNNIICDSCNVGRQTAVDIKWNRNTWASWSDLQEPLSLLLFFQRLRLGAELHLTLHLKHTVRAPQSVRAEGFPEGPGISCQNLF